MAAVSLASLRLVFLVAWTGMLLGWFYLTQPLFARGPRGYRYAAVLMRLWASAIVRIFGLSVSRRGSAPSQPAVWVANHRSYLDIAVLAAQQPVLFLAKREIADWPMFGRAARAAGIVFVDRGDASSRAQALDGIVDRLSMGISIVVFPEGTTTSGPGVLPFRPGVFRLCAERSVPVLPCAIAYADPSLAWIGDDEFLSHLLRTQRRLRNEVSLSFGAAIHPAPDVQPEQLRERAEHFVRLALQE